MKKKDAKWGRSVELQTYVYDMVDKSGVRLHTVNTVQQNGMGVTIFSTYDEFILFRNLCEERQDVAVEIRKLTDLENGAFIYDLWIDQQ